VVHAIPIAEDEFHAYLLTALQLDFILSDFRLSSGNSLHLIQKIREEFNADIPAVLLTADTSPQNLKLFNELNIQVLYKPIEANEVLKFIVEFFD
jgi:CheY-like chemotaxis protein